MTTKEQSLIGMLLDEGDELTLGELSRACRVHAEWIIELVDEGVIEPHGNELASWRFSQPCLRRVRTVLRLQRDLGVNLAGAALALDLLEEIDSLRRRLARFGTE
jgi:chaperone modulatory protein CbpM